MTRARVLYADPPWAFQTHDGRRRTPTQKKFREATASSSEALGGDRASSSEAIGQE